MSSSNPGVWFTRSPHSQSSSCARATRRVTHTDTGYVRVIKPHLPIGSQVSYTSDPSWPNVDGNVELKLFPARSNEVRRDELPTVEGIGPTKAL